MPRYFRRAWDESRGDGRDSWGTSVWHFETADDGQVSRQVEVYADGPALRYDISHTQDRHGSLSEKPLDLVEFLPFESDRATFERAWRAAQADE